MTNAAVVVGASLAGLACARRLRQHGVEVIVLGPLDQAWTTEIRGGFRLDRAWQPIFWPVPELDGLIDTSRLKVSRWEGSIVFAGHGRQHAFDPVRWGSLALADSFSLSDRLRLMDWTWECKGLTLPQIAHLPDIPAERHLRSLGLSEGFLERVMRPLASVLGLSRSLQDSLRSFARSWKCLSERSLVAVEGGLGSLTAALAEDLDIWQDGVVKELTGVRRVTGVKLQSGTVMDSSCVVIAAATEQCLRLSGFGNLQPQETSTIFHFEAPEPLGCDSRVVAPVEEGIELILPTSTVCRSVAPAGRSLVSVQCSGDEEAGRWVLDRVSALLPNADARNWRRLAAYSTSRPAVADPPGLGAIRPGMTPGRDGLYLAGETVASPSNALLSGIRCADLLMEDRMRAAA